MPKRLLRFHFVLAALASVAVYVCLALIFPHKTLIVVMNGLFTGLVVAVTILFFPMFIRAIKTKEFDRVSQLTIGIILTWLSLILSRSLSVAIQATNNEQLANSPIVAIAAYLAIIGGVLHITAPGMIENKLRYNRGLLVLALMLGIAIAVVAIIWQGAPLL